MTGQTVHVLGFNTGLGTVKKVMAVNTVGAILGYIVVRSVCVVSMTAVTVQVIHNAVTNIGLDLETCR